ncbi:MAG: hypothetical protein V4710_01070 [Verrucomicrobiota bacterium]
MKNNLIVSLALLLAAASFPPPAHAAKSEVAGAYEGDGYAAEVTAIAPGLFHVTGWQHGFPGTSRKAKKVAEGKGAEKGNRVLFSGKDWTAEIRPEAGVLIGRYENGQTWTLRRIGR